MPTKVNDEEKWQRVCKRIVDDYTELLAKLVRDKANAAVNDAVDFDSLEDDIREYLADLAMEVEFITK